MNDEQAIVVVGGGLAAATFVERLRDRGFDGPVTLFTEEPHPPYERPPLSKDLLLGKETDPVVHDERWYADHDVTLRLGTRVTSATFRLPGPLAVSVAGVDSMSGGRVELGLGSGWFEEEHDAYGIPFPTLGERFDRLEEQLSIITGMWATPEGDTFGFDGEHYTLRDSPALPKPTQTPPPIIVGGAGPKRTPALAARFAAEYNTPFLGLEDVVAANRRVDRACEASDRDPTTLLRSAALVVCVGTDERGFERRAAAIGREPLELREHGVAGLPDEAVETLGRFAEAGVERVYLQVLDLSDLEHLQFFAAEIMPRFRGSL